MPYYPDSDPSLEPLASPEQVKTLFARALLLALIGDHKRYGNDLMYVNSLLHRGRVITVAAIYHVDSSTDQIRERNLIIQYSTTVGHTSEDEPNVSLQQQSQITITQDPATQEYTTGFQNPFDEKPQLTRLSRGKVENALLMFPQTPDKIDTEI